MGTPKYNSPSYSLLEHASADVFLHGQTLPACSVAANVFIRERRERAGLFSK